MSTIIDSITERVTLPFNPYQGPEQLIASQAKVPGNLYFTTDTGKIFLDTMNDGRVALGANGAAVLFSSAENLKISSNGFYNIYQEDLDDKTATPKKNDLIINSDGRFLRVDYFSNVEERPFARCKLIAVSGTGGGGGGGSSDSGTSNPKEIEVIYESFKTSFLYGTSFDITFTPTSKVDYYLTVSWSVSNKDGVIIDSDSTPTNSGAKTVLKNVGKNIAADGNDYMITITITGANSIKYERTFTNLKSIKLAVEKRFANAVLYRTPIIQYPIYVQGSVDKTLWIDVDGQKTSYPCKSSENNIIKNITIDCEDYNLEAGVHTITAYLESGGIPSNIVKTDFAYHPEDSLDATYIVMMQYPEKCFSYEVPVVEYWVCDTSKDFGEKNLINKTINGVELNPDSLPQEENTILTWDITGLIPEQDNFCEISCNGVNKSFNIFCELSNIFDEVKDGTACILLNADGRTNNTSLENRLKWEYQKDRLTTISADLIDFNWKNNGWCKDDNNRSCLRISNGAKVEIPLDLFSMDSSGGFTFEFEFKPYNLYSYDLLTQSVSTSVDGTGEHDIVTITRTFNGDLAIISYAETIGDQTAGFCCGTQDAFFSMDNGEHATVRYMDDEIINVAVTINTTLQQIQMYVNGVLSGMSTYNNTAKFPSANKLIINSDFCDIDLYTIRVYTSNLTSQQIVQNYNASKKDFNIYNQNFFEGKDNSLYINNEINLSALEEYNQTTVNPTIPYIVFTTLEKPHVLPFFKENADVFCDIRFVNPSLDKAFESDANMTEEFYKNNAPSFIAKKVPLNVQGTSSQRYPRKNFKGKFKGVEWSCTHDKVEDKKLSSFSMREGVSEKTFTWKADFMDSSSCHNTGFASFAQELYWNHPLDYYFNPVATGGSGKGAYLQQYRTSLLGFPVLAFHEYKTSDGSTKSQFIGIYNFNLDKGADDTLGMAVDKEHPYVTYIDEKDGQEKHKTFEEVCQCWEFANNKGLRCSFRGAPFDAGYDPTLEEYTNDLKHSDLGDDLEVRYLINGDEVEGAWVNHDAPINKGGKEITAKEAFEVLLGENRTGAYAHLEKFFNWIQDVFFAFDLSKDQEWLRQILEIDDKTFIITEDNPDYIALVNNRRDRFVNEFNNHLNFEYCMIYYILTELLLMYDSRGKNMMFASWGPMREGGEYIWFPIFYDVDTQLGVNNSGVPSWEYNVEPTTGFNSPEQTPTFSTANSLLWLNFHKYYTENRPETLMSWYKILRGKSLTASRLLSYYNINSGENQEYCRQGLLPINMFNANQHYKYILPSMEQDNGIQGGYVTGIDEKGLPVYKKTSAYFYCLQGTRDLHRRQFLRNRFNYYDSKWQAQSYDPKGIESSIAYWRINAPTHEEEELAPSPILHIKPKLDQYLVTWFDEDGANTVSNFTRGGEICTVDLTDYVATGQYTQQILNIGGANNIQEFGNTSLLYANQMDYSYPSITKIELGNNNPKYKDMTDKFSFDSNGFENSQKDKPLLKVFDITNIPSITTVDLSSRVVDAMTGKIDPGSTKLEEFKALGTRLSTVKFADGVNLSKLYLPSTLTELELKNAFNLNTIVYNINDIYEQDEDGNPKEKNVMYIDNLINNNECNLNKINIIGGQLQIASYEFLKKVIDAKKTMVANNALAINMEEVHWTPYVKLGEGAEYDSQNSSKYYYATNDATFTPYQYNENTWNNDLLSNRVYYLESASISEYPITSLSLLDDMYTISKFTGLSNGSKPKISGSMYINNNDSISEADLFNTYKVRYPELEIKVNNVTPAYRARFIAYDNGVETEIATLRFDKASYSSINNPIVAPVDIPLPAHKRFMGWLQSNTPPESENLENDLENIVQDFSTIVFSEANTEYTFYALYDDELYTVIFTENDDDTKEDYITETYTVKYNSAMVSPTAMPYRLKIAINEELPLLERLAFYGWTTNKQNSGVALSQENAKNVISDLKSLKVDRNYTFYPVYVRENVLTTATNDDYFNYYETTVNNITGYSVSVKDNYQLSGKITIPSKKGTLPIVKLDNFVGALDATHIFFMEDSQLQSVGEAAFQSVATDTHKLKAVFLPNSVTTIEDKAFNNLYSLEFISDNYYKNVDGEDHNPLAMGSNITTIGELAFGTEDLNHSMSLRLSNLSTNLTEIGNMAFYKCFNITIRSLPDKLEKIGNAAFAYCGQIGIDYFPMSLKSIGGFAFAQYASPFININKITIPSPSTELNLSNKIFNYYGNHELDDSTGQQEWRSKVVLYLHPDSPFIAIQPSALGVYSIDILEVGVKT